MYNILAGEWKKINKHGGTEWCLLERRITPLSSQMFTSAANHGRLLSVSVKLNLCAVATKDNSSAQSNVYSSPCSGNTFHHCQMANSQGLEGRLWEWNIYSVSGWKNSNPGSERTTFLRAKIFTCLLSPQTTSGVHRLFSVSGVC